MASHPAEEQSERTLSRKMYKQIRRGIITNDSLDVRHRFTFMLLLSLLPVCIVLKSAARPQLCHFAASFDVSGVGRSYLTLPQSIHPYIDDRVREVCRASSNTKQIDYHHQDIPVDCYLNTATHTSPHPPRYGSQVERDYTTSQSRSVSP